MTREEAIKHGKEQLEVFGGTHREFIEMAIKALEQDTVPFDIELYQAGLMDMPKGMIDVLDKIKVEIHATAEMHEDGNYYLRDEWIDEIIDKYKAESEG